MNIIEIHSLEGALIVLGYFWFGIGHLFGKCPAYAFANMESLKNPLYVKGYFRKKRLNILDLLSNLKGMYICQISGIIIAIFSFIYIGLNIGMEERKYIWAEEILICLIKVLLIVWTIIWIYYMICYDCAFSYNENARGIWMPFQYMVHSKHDSWAYEGFAGRCKVNMEDVEDKLIKGIRQKKYQEIAKYIINDTETYSFFIKHRKNMIEIIEILHIDELDEYDFDKFNLIFEHFWTENNIEKYKNRDINLIACVCIRKKNELLEEISSIMNGTSYKKGRGRILALIYPNISERAWLRILGTRKGISKRRLHYWAVKEFSEILDL